MSTSLTPDRNVIVLNCITMAVLNESATANSRNTLINRVVRGYGKHHKVTAREVAKVLDSKVCDLLLDKGRATHDDSTR